MEWLAFGDVNPIEHGGVWVMKDTESSGNNFYVIKFDRDDDDQDKVILQEAYVDLGDNNMNWQSVAEFADLKPDSTEEERVIALVDYYGAYHLGGETSHIPVEEAVERLKDREVELSND